jgi:uncharacterized protein (DUF362 family)
MPDTSPDSSAHPGFSRRDFLQVAGVTAAGLLAASCQTAPTPTAVPSATAAPVVPTAAAATAPAPTPGKPAQVAVGRAASYDRATVADAVHKLIDQLGGLGDVVKPGNSVAIKVNLTGGVYSGQLPGVKPIESFITHPEVVRALVQEVQAAGAGKVYIVEAAYEAESWINWDYDRVAQDTGAVLVDLTNAKPYADFVQAPVGAGSYIYPSFHLNQLLLDVNVFMSVSKMKIHQLAGVSHTMKNLYGLVPYRLYRLSEQDQYRSAFHGAPDEMQHRLPRVIMDINRARPIHFSLIDGIKAIQGGEGPWITTAAPIAPGVVLAGKNCVSTDAVATAVMGHDPTADYPTPPYLRCDNHLNLAAQLGLGSNRLQDIQVLGESIESVKTQFSPAW